MTTISPVGFVGREREIGSLLRLVDEVTSTGEGRFVALRGRRQVGKSTLIEEFCARTGLRSVFFAATRGRAPDAERAAFVRTAAAALPGSLGLDATFPTWEAALDAVTNAAVGPPDAPPIIIVLDELPWLIEADPSVEGALQTAWDRALRRRPVLLVVIGSDLATMDALGAYGRPLYDRARLLRVDPLAPSEVATLTGLAPAETLDLYAAIGGFPNLIRLFQPGDTIATFLARELTDQTSPLIVAGERVLAAEVPTPDAARATLEAIGVGSRERSAIGSAGGIGGATLDRALEHLREKRIVVKSVPYSTEATASRRTRYSVVDPYLRFWLGNIGPVLPEIERGRGAMVARSISERWPTYLGSAIEPIVREALTRMLPEPKRFGTARFVGSWWTRDGRHEVDLVGGDRDGVAREIGFVGSIKWRSAAPFDDHDLRELHTQAAAVPGGALAKPVAISRNGSIAKGPVEVITPEDLVAGW